MASPSTTWASAAERPAALPPVLRERVSCDLSDARTDREDEFFTALLIEDRLRDLGFTSFAFAMDEEEAVAAVRERCPD
jgi:hypothetical protein